MQKKEEEKEKKKEEKLHKIEENQDKIKQRQEERMKIEEEKEKKEKKNKVEGKPIFKKMYYPKFINDTNVITNDCILDKNMIITGPNASGKTTTLRPFLSSSTN